MTLATAAQGKHKNDRAAEIFRAAVHGTVRHADKAAADALKYRTVRRWRRHLQRRVSAAAVGTSLLPKLHGTGILIEMPYLFRLMGRGAIGTGALAGAKVDAETDLPAIFAVWSGAISTSALVAAEGGVVVVNSIAYPAFGAKVLALGFKLGVKAAAANVVGGVAGQAIGAAAGPVGSLVQPLFGKIAAKISAKLAAKIGAKTVSDLVPLFGTTVSLGISLYILTEFLTEASRYYQHKLNDARAR